MRSTIGITLSMSVHDLGMSRELYVINAVKSQTKPMVQPTVLSPLTMRQSKIRETENAWPKTRAEKRMRMVATT